jgi:acyl-coenzyme A thioesterase PaaI-like protein
MTLGWPFVEGECYGCGDQNPIGLGLQFAREGDRCVARFVPRPEHRGVPGFLHGGVSATVLDETMASVGYMLDGVHCVTATLDLKYRRPVPLNGDELRIEAWRDDPRPRRRHKVSGRLLLSTGEIAAEAVGIFISVPDGGLAWKPR